MQLTSSELGRRFWSKVEKTGTCWNWKACVYDSGYGYYSIKHIMHRAHRLSYEFFYGAIPEGLVLDHLCYNKKCVNPDHLEPVTVLENNRRAKMNKERLDYGGRKPKNLTADQLHELRKDLGIRRGEMIREEFASSARSLSQSGFSLST